MGSRLDQVTSRASAMSKESTIVDRYSPPIGVLQQLHNPPNDGNQKVEVAREIISDARDSKPQKNLHIMDPTAKTNRKTVPNNQQSVCAHCRRGTKT
eukprot:scaffold19441_cov108-Cylindrotheca_fusiformis.AAC.2